MRVPSNTNDSVILDFLSFAHLALKRKTNQTKRNKTNTKNTTSKKSPNNSKKQNQNQINYHFPQGEKKKPSNLSNIM